MGDKRREDGGKETTRRTVTAALLAALICVVTLFLKIPSPWRGYLHLGDGVVLLAGWTLLPSDAALAAGLGSALADLLGGYAVYAPATFVIKAGMAWVACVLRRALSRRVSVWPARLGGGAVAEVWMIGGYFLFEWLLYGGGVAAVDLLVNALQGAAGLLLGVVLRHGLDRRHVL